MSRAQMLSLASLAWFVDGERVAFGVLLLAFPVGRLAEIAASVAQRDHIGARFVECYLADVLDGPECSCGRVVASGQHYCSLDCAAADDAADEVRE